MITLTYIHSDIVVTCVFLFSKYFSLLLGIISDNHGDVIKFCGDAIIVLWPVSETADDNVKSAAIKLSMMCALDLLDRCGMYRHKMTSESETVSLQLHCGISCGVVHCMCLGHLDRWEFLVSGPALKEVGLAAGAAGQGQVCVTEKCYALVEGIFAADEVQRDILRLTGHLRNTGKRSLGSESADIDEEGTIGEASADGRSSFLSDASQSGKGSEDILPSSFQGPPAAKFVTRPRRLSIVIAMNRMANIVNNRTPKKGAAAGHDEVQEIKSERSTSLRLSKEIPKTTPVAVIRSTLHIDRDIDVARAVAYLKMDSVVSTQPARIANKTRLFVPEAARVAIESGMTSFLAELRVVVTLFMEVLGLEEDFDAGRTERPSRAIAIVLASLGKYEGSLRQYVVDDKGCVIIAAFGLPGSTHEDNSVRAIETAVRVRHLLNDENIGCKMGIAQGRVYCGLVGSAARCEYAMMGSSVNLAARFMGTAAVNEIIVSEEIYQDCVNDFCFMSLPKMKAKGYAKPVAAYMPKERFKTGGLLLFGGGEAEGESLVDRKRELTMLLGAMDSFMATGKATFVTISGTVGIGKSWLFSKLHCHIVNRCPSIKKIILHTSSAHDTNSRYYCVRQIFDQVLGVSTRKQEVIRGGAQSTKVGVVQPASHNPASNKKLMFASSSLVGAAAEKECVELTTRALLAWMSDHAEHLCVRDLDVDPEVYISSETSNQCEALPSSCFLENQPAPLSGDTPIVDLIPLLDQILCIDIDQTELCSHISYWARAKLCTAIIIKILSMTALSRDHVLLIENLHLCDLPSLEILCKLLSTSQTGCFVATIRSQHRSSTADASECVATPHKFITLITKMCSMCVLHPLTKEEIRAMIETTIPQRFLRSEPDLLRPSSIAQIITRTDAKPYLTSAFILTLRDALVNGKYRGLEYLPSGEQNIIVNRFDKLNSKQQMILKVASVIGDTFSLEFLRDVLEYMDKDMRDSVAGLKHTLSLLVYSTLIMSVPFDAQAEDAITSDDNVVCEYYKFTTKNVRYSIYNLMLSTQKEETHNIVGKLLERIRGSKIGDICKHYLRSNNTQKKLQYLQESIFRAHVDCDMYALKSLLSKLLTIATGMCVQELLEVCSNTSSSGAKRTEDALDFMRQFRRMKGLVHVVSLDNQWLEGRNMARKVEPAKCLQADLETPEEGDALAGLRDSPTRVLTVHSSARLVSTMGLEFGREQQWLAQPITTVDTETVCFWIAELGSVEFRCVCIYFISPPL